MSAASPWPEAIRAPYPDGKAALRALRRAMQPVAAENFALSDQHDGPVLFSGHGFELRREAFAFTSPGGVRFRYRLGEALAMSHVKAELAEEAELLRWGTVYAAIAWLNGMLVLHASAVAFEHGAVAFSADKGGGKSTLAAGLSALGYPALCDDTLVLAPTSQGLMALPDAKPAKLWADACKALSLAPSGPIGPVDGKHYAAFPARCEVPLPLRDLVFLERGEIEALVPLSGADKLSPAADALYRGFLHTERAGSDDHARLLLGLAQQARFWRLSRPFLHVGLRDQVHRLFTLVERGTSRAR